MKNIFFLFFILPSLYITTAWGTDYQNCKLAFEDIASEIWNNFNTLPDYCQEKIKAEQNKYSDNTSFALNERYKPDFRREFAVIACSGDNKPVSRITMNEYANEYSNWATKTCEKIFSNPDTTSTDTVKFPIFGYIVDEKNAPISGANIKIIETDSLCSTLTDQNGYWEIKSCTIPTPDSSRIMISHNNYKNTSYNLSQHEKDKIVQMFPKEDTPTSTDTVKFPIFGYIKDRHDNPISGAEISISKTQCKTTTDPYGYWEIKSCTIPTPDSSSIEISHNNYYDMYYNLSQHKNGDTENMSLKEDTPTSTGTTKLPIFGYIVDEKNAPISGANVKIIETDSLCSTLTDQNGYWRIENCTLPDAPQISIGHTGYEKQTILLSEFTNNSKIKLTLNTANNKKTDKIPSEGACNKEQLATIKHATAGELKKGKCHVTKCEPGYEPENNKCIEIAGNCQKKPENAKKSHRKFDSATQTEVCIIDECKDGYNISDDSKSCIKTEKAKLSEEDSKKKIAELQENADAMRAKEQSTANKLLGGASMAATGIGGMQALSAYSEQQADEDAEQAMKAYLATFHCNYGGGINIRGGEKNVELPGGNELVGLYSEYVNLANDLKVRKAALDMRPGIESETILDSATSGLYDDISIGKTSGAFASLARALQDPNSADAAAWAKQKSDTASQLKTGLTVAGIGAIGGAVGNYLINKDAPKERSDEINRKYESLKKLEQEVAKIPPQSAPCPSGTTGNKWPECTCTDSDSRIFNPNTNACEECQGGQTAQNGECKCPTDKPLWDTSTEQCIAKQTVCTPECTPTKGDHLRVMNDCSCTCDDGYDFENNMCTCKSPKQEKDGKCITVEINTIINTVKEETLITTVVDNITLSAASLFEIGKYDLRPQAKEALENFVTNLQKEGTSKCKLTIKGYTDPVGSEKTNNTLSENRAKAVKEFIDSKNVKTITEITASGEGEKGCTCGTGKNEEIDYTKQDYKACKNKEATYQLTGDARFAPCRRVEISAECEQTTTNTQTTSN